MTRESGPTQGAELKDQPGAVWASHPKLAALIRSLIVVVPVVLGVAFSWSMGRWAPPDKLGINRWIWLAGVFVAASTIIHVAQKISSKLLPLVALMKLSLIFPNHAPSRAKSALRQHNGRAMVRQLSDPECDITDGDTLADLLVAINEHDRLTRGHSERVRAYSELIGEELKLSDTDMNKLRWAALLHDVGKLTVPEEILNKDSRPTDEEWKTLQGHPAAGGAILQPLHEWLGDWIHAADQHHLRWDGKGYPSTLGGTDISLPGRLVAVADAYDVMTSARSYKKPLSHEIARQELTDCAGSQFDPKMVRAFLNVGLTRLKAAVGPFSWFANAATTGQVPIPVASSVATNLTTGVTLAATAGATMIAGVTGAATVAEPNLAPESLAMESAIELVVEDLNVLLDEDDLIELRLEAVGGTGAVQLRVGQPDHGDLILGSSEEWPGDGGVSTWVQRTTYFPARDYNGGDAFTYEACDEADVCNTATVMLRIEPINDAPRPRPDRVAVKSGGTVTVDVLANDEDPEGDAMDLRSISQPDFGDVEVDGQLVRYTSTEGYVGLDEFTYTVADADGATESMSITIEVTEGEPPEEIPLAPQPTPPPRPPRAADPAPSPTPLPTAEPVPTTPPPPLGNQTPVANNDVGLGFVATEDTGFTTADVTANDTDVDNPIDPTTLTLITNGTRGTGTANPDGTIDYTPNANTTGIDTLTYTITDSNGATSNTATVTISIVPVNDPPMAANDSGLGFVATEDTGFTTNDVTANDSDPDNPIDPTTLTLVTNGTRGTGTANPDGTIDYTPNANTTGIDTLTYTITDSNGATSSPATVTIFINSVNDAPSFTAGADITVNEDSGTSTTAGWATAISTGPPNEATQTLTFNVTNTNNALFATQPAISPTGTLTFTPAPNANGTATVSVTATDNGGTANGGDNTSPTQTLTITINSVNDEPSFTAGADITVNEDSGTSTTAGWATAISTGPPNEATQTLTFNVTNTNNALFATQPAISPTGTLTFTPAPNANGTATVSVTATDNGGTANGGDNTSPTQTLTITINSVNDEPSFTAGADITVNEDSGTSTTAGWATAISTGPPNEATQTLTFNVTNTNNALFATQPAISPTGTLTFTPAPNANGTATVSVTATDNGGTANGGDNTSPTQTLTITINSVNDAPVAADDAGTGFVTLEDTPFSTGDVTANDSDVDDPVDATTTTLDTPAATGTAVSNGDGTFNYSPGADLNGADTFTYTIEDPNTALSNSATVTITVTPVNDAPSFTAGADITVNEDSGTSTTAGWATAISTGPPNEATQTLTFNVTNTNNALFATQPAISPTGTLTFTPAPNANGTATVSVTAIDNGGTANGGDNTSPTQTLTITVLPDDHDGIDYASDNCPTDFNPVQTDTDGDTIGDACDPAPTVSSAGSFAFFPIPLGTGTTRDAATADIDGDGDADLILAYQGGPNRVYETPLLDTGQDLGSDASNGVATGDFDGDGDFDAVFANGVSDPNTVWINDGTGAFTDSGQTLGSADSRHVALGDLDGDGDLDMAVANDNEPNTVWLNNGTGTFTDSGQTLGSAKSREVALRDLDGDGDLDMAVANDNDPDTVWLNNGTGTFTDSGQTLGLAHTRAVAAADIDGDGDIDLLYADHISDNTVWLNNGTGTFTDSGQTLGNASSQDLDVGDIDGDGDLDVVFAIRTAANTVWLNDGSGTFTDSGQALGFHWSVGVLLGDFTGDGKLDLFVANDTGDPNRLYVNF